MSKILYAGKMENKNAEWEFAGTVGVDGGHVIIADPCYADDMVGDWVEKTVRGNQYYEVVKDGVCRLFQGFAGGVIVQAGMGDGAYRVFVKRGTILGNPDCITHMMIDFTDRSAYRE